MRTIISILLFMFCFQLSAQTHSKDNTNYNKSLNALISAINKRNFSLIESHLSSEFRYSTYDGNMGKAIFKQVIEKFPKIDSIKKISKVVKIQETSVSVAIHYNSKVEYKKIIYDHQYKIKQADIAEIAIGGHNNQFAESKRPSTNSKLVKKVFPFIISKTGHIVVSAKINGHEGNFVVDSGLGGFLLLNERFATFKKENSKNSSLGVFGKIEGAYDTTIDSFIWKNYNLGKTKVTVANLEHLGERMSIDNFAGAIGFELLKNQIVEFDYDKKQLTLWQSKKEFEENYSNSNITSVGLKMIFHIPAIDFQVGKHTLRLGIDSGAQGNILLPHLETKLQPFLINKLSEKVGGADNNYRLARKVEIKNMKILNQKFSMDFLIENLFGGNHEVTMMDGLVGYPFLSSQPIAINFIDNQLYFIN